MNTDNSNSKVTLLQILTRTICVVVCAIGASACVYSLTLQVEEIGTTMSSVVWFSGLFAVVAACGGYAAACNPRQGNSWIVPAVIGVVGGAGVALQYELMYLRSYNVVALAAVAFAICVIWLLIYRQILKRQDPDAL